jgi:hypothetical protein
MVGIPLLALSILYVKYVSLDWARDVLVVEVKA